MTRRLRLITLALAAPLLLALPASVGARTAEDPILVGTIGTAGAPDAFRISLADVNGNAVSRVLPGTYTLKIKDFAQIHNFHFYGPGGVSVASELDATGDLTFTVTLVNGRYTYQCDAHPSSIRGSLLVGPPPVPPTKLTAAVAATGAVTIRKAGVVARTLPAGRYVIAVADASKKENFHLTGPAVNAKTTLLFKGSKKLAVTLKAGAYRYRSDAHPKLGRALKVIAATPPR